MRRVTIAVAGALLSRPLQNMGVSAIEVKTENGREPDTEVRFARPWHLLRLPQIADEVRSMLAWLDEAFQ